MSLKTSVGGRDSNSFATLAEANSHIADLPNDSTEWDGLSDDQKEYRLILAAQLMSMLPWKGRRTYCGQNLALPRDVPGMKTGYPADVKNAQTEIAYLVIHRGLSNMADVTDSASGSDLKSISLGGLLTVSYAGSSVSSGSLLDRVGSSVTLQTYLRLVPYLSQIRGVSVRATTDTGYPTCSSTSTTTTTTTTNTQSSTTSSTSSTHTQSSTTTTTQTLPPVVP